MDNFAVYFQNIPMKKLVLSLFFFLSIILIGNRSSAQNYQTAVGLKFGGFESGPSIKYFTSNAIALEGIVGFRSHGVVITGLYEIHQVAFGVPALKFYYGAGAHIGAEGSGVYQPYGGSADVNNQSHILLGVDGVLGLEYKIPNAPIAVSVDVDPRAELAVGPYFDIAPALGLKYTF
jgi:hypothetical protein